MAKLNNVVNFEFIGPCYYELGDMRKPLRGEYFLFGAIVTAYKAYSDLDMVYRIVTPTTLALPVKGYVRGRPIIICRIATDEQLEQVQA